MEGLKLGNSFENKDRGQEIKEQVKSNLGGLQKEILSNLEGFKDKNLEKINNDLLTFLDSEDFSLEDNNVIFKYQKELYSPKYENNQKALELRKIVDILSLPGDINVDDAVNTISKVYDDKNISKFTKLRLAKCLRNNYFGYLVDNTEDGGYISNPMKGVEIANKLTKKYPNYDFESFVLVQDYDR